MNLPHSKNASVEERKLRAYLLSDTHSVGKVKAKYFRELGYGEDNVDLLRDALLRIAIVDEVSESVATPFGVKYVVDGELVAPAGIVANIRTVWILEEGETNPRFVTAYPSGRRAKE
jgi:hypothetical protein